MEDFMFRIMDKKASRYAAFLFRGIIREGI